MILSNIYYQLICVFIIGLILGSFYNVIIIRTISNESIISPPSKCPLCQNELRWYHNIPIVSYIFLKGKCAFCKQEISSIYPIIELCSGILFVTTFLKLGFSFKSLFCITTLSLFLILSGMDTKTKTINLKYSIALIISALLFNYTNLFASILGGLMGLGVMFLLKKLSYFFNKETIGEGDIYAFGALGAFVGLNHLPLIFIITLFIQGGICVFKLRKKYNSIALLFWFLISYILVALIKYNTFSPILLFKILIFLNFLVSLYMVCKHLFLAVKQSQEALTVPFLPAIFISAFLFLFLI